MMCVCARVLYRDTMCTHVICIRSREAGGAHSICKYEHNDELLLCDVICVVLCVAVAINCYGA